MVEISNKVFAKQLVDESESVEVLAFISGQLRPFIDLHQAGDLTDQQVLEKLEPLIPQSYIDTYGAFALENAIGFLFHAYFILRRGKEEQKGD